MKNLNFINLKSTSKKSVLLIFNLSILVFLLASSNLSAQWSNASGLTEHEYQSDDILFSGSSMTGVGTKMFWDQGKVAFRGGNLKFSNANYWDLDSLGMYSFSFGEDTRAVGNYSISFGVNSYAKGNNSFSGGTNSTATGYGSFSYGLNTNSIGYCSFASGNNSTSQGDYSFTTGIANQSIGERTFTAGSSNQAIGNFSVSIGNSNTVTGSSSFAMGSSNSMSAGNNSAIFGSGSTSSGSNSFIAGGNNTAQGSLGCTVLGYSSRALNVQSVAIGYNLEASADGAFVLGVSHSGGGYNTIKNDIENSMMIGFESNLPTLFIGPGSGFGTTGNIGVATTTPLEKLEVNGAIKVGSTATNNTGTLRFNGTDFQGYNGSSWLSLTQQNTDSQMLNLNGNTLSLTGGNSVTIPSGADNWGTQVANTDATLTGDGTSANLIGLAQQGASSGQVLKWDGSTWAPDNDNSGASYWNQTGSALHYSSGLVGIGTNTPGEELHIHANDKAIIKFTNSSAPTNGFQIGFSTGSNKRAQIWNKEDAHLVFGTNNLERVRIHKSGSMGIGTGNNIPQQKLEVVGAINIGNASTGTAGAIRWNGSDFEGYDGSGWVSLTAGNGGGASPWTQSSTGTDVYFDASGGKVGIGTDTPMDELHVLGDIGVSGEIHYPSDARLKTNVAELNGAMEIIIALQPKHYNYKKTSIEEFKLPSKKQYGLIAQEVAEVLPSIVNQEILKSTTGEVYMGINYDQLIPLLIAGIKEQQVVIDTLISDKEKLTQRVDKNTQAIAQLTKLLTEKMTYKNATDQQ